MSSWNYAVEQISQALERMVQWYREFMHRTEQSFKALHARIIFLEERQSWKGPSDEQVERILRKILAERFADAGIQRVENPNVMADGAYFVQNPHPDPSPRPLDIDAKSVLVDPNAVPTRLYAQTLSMLEGRFHGFPDVDLHNTGLDPNSKDGGKEFKRPILPLPHSRPWS